MDDAVRDYVAAIDPAHRPLFDRFQALVVEVHPDVEVVLSYRMPTFVVGTQRLYVGMWKHGLSVYGWDRGRAQAFVERHPDLITSKGTIKIGPADAELVSDEEFRGLIRGALDE